MLKVSKLFYLRAYCTSTLKSQEITLEYLKKYDEVNLIKPEIPQEKYESTFELFTKYGFKNQDVSQIIRNNGQLLLHPSKLLNHNIEFWRNFEFSQKQFEELILEHPEVLNIKDHQHVAKQISHIKYYVKTPKNTWLLLINSPEIITRKEEEIKEYFVYLEDRMRLVTPEIVKSKVFTKSLNELKCRHIFLERLGLFKPRSLKSDPNAPTKNPRLYKIIDTSDNEFCKKICGISLVEFETFIELYNIEQEKTEEEGDSDDDQ